MMSGQQPHRRLETQPLWIYGLHQVLVLLVLWLGHWQQPAEDVLAGLNRMDGGWYLSIAEHGYVQVQQAAFFPLYPWLIRVVHGLTGVPWQHASLLVSNLCLLPALIVTYRYFADQHPPAVATVATALLASMPASFFFSAGYAESLFLLFSASALLCLRQGSNLVAAGAICLATLARPQGLCLVAAALPQALRDVRERRVPAGLLAASLAGVLGLLIYMLVLNRELGDSLAFVHAQRYWDRHLIFPGIQLLTSFQIIAKMPMRPDQLLMELVNACTGLAAIGLVAYYCRRAEPAGVLYVLTYLLLTLSSAPFLFSSKSVARYLTCLLPAYAWVAPALARRPWLLAGVLLVNGLLFLRLTAYFVLGFLVQ